MAATYEEFLEQKTQLGGQYGFSPRFMPDYLFDFQRSLVEFAVSGGRRALFADCGLGKSPMSLVWGQNVIEHTNKPVLLLTPLGVTSQFIREAEKFGVDAYRSPEGALRSGAAIVVTNYERLHYFNPSDFSGVICDESSILKNISGATRKQVIRFMNKTLYRLLCTATAAPNDYPELGNSSEALGELSYSEMINQFFRYLDDKGQKRDQRLQDEAEELISLDENNYYKKLAYRVSQTIGQYRLRHHAIVPFWRWVASWARACRMPSDLGFPDGDFILPPLESRTHIIQAKPAPGCLFTQPALGMAEERDERARTLHERCEFVAELVNHNRPAVVWCHRNDEADLLEEIIPDAKQIAGVTPDDRKVELYDAFAGKSLRVLVIKPKIGAWGLNWQHCNHVVSFVSHSYEQDYQSIRRCWRYGQKETVVVDRVATEGEVRVIANLKRKAAQAEKMFNALVHEMNHAVTIERENRFINPMEVPLWLS